MDTLITFAEVVALLANPPTLAPRPNFSNLRALRRHMQRGLQRLSCPQSNILGWAGLVMSRAMYSLLTPTPFRLPNDPGPQAVYYGPRVPIVDAQGDEVLDADGNPTYVQVAPLDRATQATIDARFVRSRNYWLSYQNIKRACFNMLDDNIDDAFKVSNSPTLRGWNQSMEIGEILDQITTTYGRPTPNALLQNDMLFRSAYSPADAPETLFRRIEDCQEVQLLGEDEYTPKQLLNNAIRLLLQCGLYTREFEDWDRKAAADKVWTELKTFIQEAYTRRLNATNITAGQHGYVQNAYAALAEESTEEEDDDVQTVITQMAALTTQSQVTAASQAATTSTVTTAINQLVANQQAMSRDQQAMSEQIAAFANVARAPPAAVQFPTQFNIPPINIPHIGNLQGGGNRATRREGRGRGEYGGRQGQSGGRNTRTPFANYVARQAGGGLPTIAAIPTTGVPFRGTGPGAANATHSNIVKRYANMNACFSCGFDVETGHTSKTCPATWRRANHQEGYNRNNAQQYIAAGYDACTKAMHKTQYPNF